MRPAFTRTLHADEPFLRDHRIHGACVLPAAMVIELFRAAVVSAGATGAAAANSATVCLESLLWPRPLRVDAPSREIEVTIDAAQGRASMLALTSCVEPAGRVVYCRARAIAIDTAATPPAPYDLATLRARATGTIAPGALYAALGAVGFDYGPAHRTITALHACGDTVLAELRLPDALYLTLGDVVVHPSLLDGALQAAQALTSSMATPTSAQVPFAMARVTIAAPCVPHMWAVVRRGTGPGLTNLVLCDEQGRVAVRVDGYAARPLPAVPPRVLS